jgi:H/ACA ribonucleoprotein complex non-core subunit NAF1
LSSKRYQAMDAFKVPPNIPQDLLLIQSIVGTVPPVQQQSKPIAKAVEAEQDSDIESSGSETDSEDEIEAQLVADVEDNGEEPSSYATLLSHFFYLWLTLYHRHEKVDTSSSDSDSDSDSDTSSSEEEDQPHRKQNNKAEAEDLELDDEDSGPAATTQSYFHTKNEIVEANIIVPDIEEVGTDERLERVGEIMTIMDNVVVVRGDATDLSRATDRALDSDTLLVFEDRKVLGYVSDFI